MNEQCYELCQRADLLYKDNIDITLFKFIHCLLRFK